MGIATDLPGYVLAKYDMQIEDIETIKDGETQNNYWRIKSADSVYLLWKYQGDLGLLQEVLEWRELLAEKGYMEFPLLYKTKSGKNFVQEEQNGYFVTLCSPERYAYFSPEKSSGFIKVVDALSRLNTATKNLAVIKDKQTERPEKVAVYWLTAYQEKLNKLLCFYRYLQEKRLANDFERLFVENFEGFYERGQQAIQRMVLASSSLEESEEAGFLIGNFLPKNMLETETGMIFLNMANYPKGLPIHDLSLFLKMYLPLQKWDAEFALKLLTRYQEKVALANQEKHLFLALLSFPGRFCTYTQQYWQGTGDNISELAINLINYLCEIYWQDRCLERLEKSLWGE